MTLAEQAAANLRHPLTLALLALTFSTGTVDAVSYLGLGHVFTANMTGNVVLLAFGIAGAGHLPVLAPIVSMVTFALGVGAGGVLGQRHPADFAVALALEGAMLTAAAILVAVATIHPGSAPADVTIALMATAMGIRNATVRRLAVPDLTTTVLTMTLTGLAADSKLAGGTGKGTVRRSMAILSMLVGALCGALMLRTGLVLPLAFAAGLALVACLAYPPAGRAASKSEASGAGSPKVTDDAALRAGA